MDNASHVGQADAGAFELFGGVKALKHAEELVRILPVEPDAVVPNEHDRLAGPAGDGADLDLSGRACGRVFDCVGQQVHEHEAEQGSITVHGGQIVQLPDDRLSIDADHDLTLHSFYVSCDGHVLYV